jgi:hypothetical protein
MGFKHFYNSSKNNKDHIFEEVFNKHYERGYFGTIDKKIVKEKQQSWFNKFLMILEQRDCDNLTHILLTRDNVLTREWFSKIYETDILAYSKEDIKAVVAKTLKEG